VVAEVLGKTKEAKFYRERSKNYRTIFNNQTGFMEARFANGSWAGEDAGWTEGDKWCYTVDVVQDVPGLIDLKGGADAFVNFLDKHFDGGHNDHT
jgi:putative alpha-1,2-mannosidase